LFLYSGSRTFVLAQLRISLPLFFAAVACNAQVPKQAVSGAIRPHGRLSRTAFYDTSTPLPPAPAGSLIRSEQFEDYTLPPGIVAVRFLYHSRSDTGEDVPASGVVLVPEGNAPPRGWPIIAWAHRFQGIARECAPSLQENLNEGSYFAMYAKLGYAVVAADYAGLGTNARAGYLNLRANSLDVIYAVAAARRAAPQVGTGWIAVGEADGGLVAASVAEMESHTDTPGFLGSIAIGGLFDPEEMIRRLEKQDPGKMIYLAYGIKGQAPEFDVSGILTEQALKLFGDAAKSCDEPDEFRLSTAAQLLKPGWEANPLVQRFFATNMVGKKSTSGPLLVLASDSDSTMPSARTASIVKRLCNKGDRVLFYSYPTPNSQTLMGESVTDQIAWVRARFAEQIAPSNCH
jgi:Secretory lipase